MSKKKLLGKKQKDVENVEVSEEVNGDNSVEQEDDDSGAKFNIKRIKGLNVKKIAAVVAVIVIILLIFIVWRQIQIRRAPEFEDVTQGSTDLADTGKPIENYFKFTGNTLYEYTQKNGSNLNRNMFVAYSDFDTVQYSVYSNSLGDAWYNQVYEVKDGELRNIINDTKYKQNVALLDYKSDEEPIVLLKEPVVLGNQWLIGRGEAEASITKVDYDVKTPKGLYKTVEVTTDYKNGSYKKDYYSETIGLVKTISLNNDGTVTDVELTNTISLSTGLDRAMYVYYLEKETFNNQPILVEYNQPTNKHVADVFTELLKVSKDDNYKPLISPYTKVNFIELDKDLKVVHVDLSKEFLDYTSKNKNIETKHLNALANTFCRYYQVLNMELTIDGMPYSSANYKMGENDTIRATFR